MRLPLQLSVSLCLLQQLFYVLFSITFLLYFHHFASIFEITLYLKMSESQWDTEIAPNQGKFYRFSCLNCSPPTVLHCVNSIVCLYAWWSPPRGSSPRRGVPVLAKGNLVLWEGCQSPPKGFYYHMVLIYLCCIFILDTG